MRNTLLCTYKFVHIQRKKTAGGSMKAVRREKQTQDETSLSSDSVLPRAKPNCTSHTTNIIPSTVQGTCARLGRWKKDVSCDTHVVEDPPSSRDRPATAAVHGATFDRLWLLTALLPMVDISTSEDWDGTRMVNMALMKDPVFITLSPERAQKTVPRTGMFGVGNQPWVASNGKKVREGEGLALSASAAAVLLAGTRSSLHRMHHCAVHMCVITCVITHAV